MPLELAQKVQISNLTVNYYHNFATMYCDRFSTILCISYHNNLITLMKSGITTKYWFVKTLLNLLSNCVLFPICSIYYPSNTSIEEEHQVFFQSVVNFPDNYWRHFGDSYLRYYRFSSFLLIETPGFSELLCAPPPGPGLRLCPGDFTASSRPPAGKCNDSRHDISLNNLINFWVVLVVMGYHMKFSQTDRRINNFSAASMGGSKI